MSTIINDKKNLGIGLIELTLALVIIAILLITAMRYYLTASLSEKVNDAISMVQAIKSAGQRTLLTQSSIPSNTFVYFSKDHNYIPSNFNKTPWGTKLDMAPYSGGKIQITMENIPNSACVQLKTKLQETTTKPTPCGGGDTTDYVGVFLGTL